MKAIVLEDIGRLEMRDVPVPEIGPRDVLIRTGAATICTSDLNDIDHNPFGIQLPMIIGHEGAGTIAAVGAEVEGFAVGDAVAAHPVMPCMRCDSCKRGLFHLCDDMEHLGITRGGTFAEYFTIRADRIRKKPPELTFAQASLLEPVCVCLEAIERAEVREGSNVMVVGDGPFGVMITRLAFSRRPARVVLVGRHPFRLAQVPGAVTINERESEDLQAEIRVATGGEGVDCAVLAVGTAQAVDVCMEALRARGTLSVFSGIPQKAPVDLWKLHIKELNIHGSCNDMDALDEAMALLSEPSLGLAGMITHEFSPEHWRDAFDMAANGKDRALKVSVVWEGNQGE